MTDGCKYSGLKWRTLDTQKETVRNRRADGTSDDPPSRSSTCLDVPVEQMDRAPLRPGLEHQTAPGQSVTFQISVNVEVNVNLGHLTNEKEGDEERSSSRMENASCLDLI